jgi:hypothetical protein
MWSAASGDSEKIHGTDTLRSGCDCSGELGSNSLRIRDLQKLSAETIRALPGPTTVKSGGLTVALLVPLKAADPDRLAAVLTRAEALAKGRGPAADDAALAPFGEIDPVDWSVEAERALRAAPARG